jgi:hypothetical protein
MSMIDKAAENASEEFVGEVEFSGGYSLKKLAKDAMNKIGDPKLVLELAIIGAMRGNNPKDAAEIKLCNGSTLESFLDSMQRNGIFHRGRPGAYTQGAGDKLTMSRLAAAFAEPVAMSLKKAHSAKPLQKRFKLNKLPPYYEFAAFGTLELSRKMRDEHLIFSHEFSKAISQGKETLDESIYNKMLADTVELRNLKLDDAELLMMARPTENVRDLCDLIDRE